MTVRARSWAASCCTLICLGCGAAGENPEQEASLPQDQSALVMKEELFTPAPDPGALTQIAGLIKSRHLVDAARLAEMVVTPQAIWFTGGTPAAVKKTVKKVMLEAKAARRTPVLVAYNVPFRDCAQYSGGGAVDTAAYKAWIDGFAAGIGTGKAIVILEPDSLGIIPYNVTIYGAHEWCQPTVPNPDGSTSPAPGATPDERYTQLQYAASALTSAAPSARVYLDGTHGGWLGVGEAAYRLYRATHDPATGASLAKGFFLNVSNFRTTAESTQFGTWVSMCTAFATNAEEGGWRLGHFDWCPSQYNPATDFALDYSPEYAASVTAQLQGLMGSATAQLPFVVDTSRNGQGPLDASTYAAAPYNQPTAVVGSLTNGNWCNPPSAGLGKRPTLATGTPLADAYLWIKIPGESDGSCDIAGGARAWDYGAYNPWGVSGDAANHFDPLWGITDPAAGAWFPQQALALARNANPALF